jgi:hypothetical protein
MIYMKMLVLMSLSIVGGQSSCGVCGPTGSQTACADGEKCCDQGYFGTYHPECQLSTATDGDCATTTCICAAGICAASADGDPHFTGADRDRFDFKGLHKKIYNLLSAVHVTLNALFEHKDYHEAGPKHRLVKGSYMMAAYMAVRTAAGRMISIEYDAARAVFVKIGVNGTDPTAYKAPFSMTLDDVSVALDKRAATIKTSEWTISLSSKMKPGMVGATSCADGKCFLEVKASPLVDVATLKVAPHGLIGQTYDGDGVGVIGKTDDYKTRDNTVTTSAMGEGAIEGVAADYEMASKFATTFKFSRFGLEEAKPRDASKLGGEKVAATGAAANAAGA